MPEQDNKVKRQMYPQKLDKLIELRGQIKSRTPDFQRQESWRYVRIHKPWRKPKGVDSHMRLSVKGWPSLVKVGYRVPGAVREMHPSGLRDVLVHNLAELEKLVPQKDGARLAATLGRKKKIILARRAKELSIRVLNGRGLLRAQKPEEATKDTAAEKSKAKKTAADTLSEKEYRSGKVGEPESNLSKS